MKLGLKDLIKLQEEIEDKYEEAKKYIAFLKEQIREKEEEIERIEEEYSCMYNNIHKQIVKVKQTDCVHEKQTIDGWNWDEKPFVLTVNKTCVECNKRLTDFFDIDTGKEFLYENFGKQYAKVDTKNTYFVADKIVHCICKNATNAQKFEYAIKAFYLPVIDEVLARNNKNISSSIKKTREN